MKKVSAILGCNLKSPDSILQRGNEVLKGMTGNLHYPSPPDLVVFAAVLSQAEAAQITWGSKGERGSKADLINFRANIKSLYEKIQELHRYVNLVTPNDAVKLATSGFPLSHQPGKLPLLDPPRNLRRISAKNIGLEKVRIKCTKPANATPYQRIFYKFYRSLTPNFSEAEVIAECMAASYTDVPKQSVPGFYFYWVTAVSPAGESEPSDVLKAVVVPL